MKDTKVQWHPGFVAAMNLELAKNRNDLIFVKEYNLNTKPVELFRYFEKHQYTITTPYRGVYYIEGVVLFPTPIIVTKELERDTHIWLKVLSDRIEKRDMEELLKRISRLTEQGDRELADSVLEVSAQVNKEVLEELKGDDNVSEALLEIMQPLIEPLIATRVEAGIETQMLLVKETVAKEALREGKKEGIQGTVDVLRDLGHGGIEIKQIIQKKYGLTDEELAQYI